MNTKTETKPEFGDDYAGNQLARRKSVLRRIIKSVYVGNVLKLVKGPTKYSDVFQLDIKKTASVIGT